MVYERVSAPYKIRYDHLPSEEYEMPSITRSNTEILGDLALKWIFIGAGMPNLPLVPGVETAPLYSTTLVATAAVAEAGEKVSNLQK
ncbi:MAG TPA: hypothetical protein VFB03_01625 [Candidatus Saccharimonadales bacterium]|nr:hypothetical protein [Candidatus Saccharimonadales bacterium]